jgi:hypothetical protein
MFTLNKQFLFFNVKMAMKGEKNGLKGAQNQPKTGQKRKPNKKRLVKKRLTANRRLTAIRLAETVSRFY